jgi:hypothetical protein
MATGATLLGKAHSVKSGIYTQAFFSLSIGMERAGKLAFVLDYCFENNGTFPSNAELRTRFGHDIRKLIEKADEISQRRRPGDQYERCPRSPITEGIIDTLTDFANGTRYYNLDLLNKNKSSLTDPIRQWYERVGKLILNKHYNPRQKAKHSAEAAMVNALMDNVAFVMQTTETGDLIDSLSQGFLHSKETAVMRRYSRMYAMQINRFLATLLSDMGREAYKYRYGFIPHMGDFFAIFRNDDRYFLNRETWSIYRP